MEEASATAVAAALLEDTVAAEDAMDALGQAWDNRTTLSNAKVAGIQQANANRVASSSKPPPAVVVAAVVGADSSPPAPAVPPSTTVILVTNCSNAVVVATVVANVLVSAAVFGGLCAAGRHGAGAS